MDTPYLTTNNQSLQSLFNTKAFTYGWEHSCITVLCLGVCGPFALLSSYFFRFHYKIYCWYILQSLFNRVDFSYDCSYLLWFEEQGVVTMSYVISDVCFAEPVQHSGFQLRL